MPTLHKNISAEVDIHNPKWFPNANNGDVSWKNELGVLESTDELVLPAALNFVDASVAPPTTNAGDIYVLSSGGSVNAGWGSVALDDWVRYDGTDWNSITPQKSTLCYNENDDVLYSYDGALWNQIGGDSIYTADGTVPDDTTATLTNSLVLGYMRINIGTNSNKFGFGHVSEMGKTDDHNGANTLFGYNASDNAIRLKAPTATSGFQRILIHAGSTNIKQIINANGIIIGNNLSDVTTANADLEVKGDAIIGNASDSISFYGATIQAKQTVTGSRGGNAALADLLTKLANLGLITDSTT